MKLLLLTLVCLALAGAALAQNSAWQTLPPDTAHKAIQIANGIDFVDSAGIARVNIAAYSPDPVINGVRYKRDVQVSGITLRDNAGNETGGMGVINGTRTSVLAFDYTTREAVVLWTADDPVNASTGLMLNERLTQAADTAGRNRQRIVLQVEKDLPSLVFLGKDGTPRITIGLDSLDNPVIRVVDKDGNTRDLVK